MRLIFEHPLLNRLEYHAAVPRAMTILIREQLYGCSVGACHQSLFLEEDLCDAYPINYLNVMLFEKVNQVALAGSIPIVYLGVSKQFWTEQAWRWLQS